MLKYGTFFATVLVLMIIKPSKSDACSCGRRPTHELWVGEAGTVPVDGDGILYWTDHTVHIKREHITEISTPDPHIVVKEIRMKEVPFTLERITDKRVPQRGAYFRVKPLNWAQGKHYSVYVPAPDERLKELHARVIVGPPAGGTPQLNVSDVIQGDLSFSRGAACSEILTAQYRNVQMDLNQFNPSNFYFQTFVDGREYNRRSSKCQMVAPGSSWVGRGRDRIDQMCSGSQTVRMLAFIPGTNVEFEASAKVRCPPALPDQAKPTSRFTVYGGLFGAVTGTNGRRTNNRD